MQEDDGEHERYRAKEHVDWLDLKARRLEIVCGAALLLAEAALLHSLHFCCGTVCVFVCVCEGGVYPTLSVSSS